MIFSSSSDLQCGFKTVRGCRDAISVLRNTIEYYTAGGSTVNVVSLDISKAFGNVNLYGLADKLVKRNIPRQFVV